MTSLPKEKSADQLNHPVMIIGAGSSGLSAAYHLLQKGLQPILLDAAPSAGASWHKRHPQLSLNTHRIYSGLPGMPIHRSKGTFVTRDDYIAYLEEYACWLEQHFHASLFFNTSVERVEPAGPYWRVITPRESYLTRHIIVATGPDREPYMPPWEGIDGYRGAMVHAADFGHIDQYDDKHVLIVGGANSGIDIANHLTQRKRCASLQISMRHGSHLLPTYVAGIPIQLTGPVLAKLPLWCQDLSGNLFSRLSFGNLTKLGIKTPIPGVASRLKEAGVAPGFDHGFVKALKNHQIKVVPEVRRLTKEGALFIDGSRRSFDHIICATGYRTGLSKLLPEECLQPPAALYPSAGKAVRPLFTSPKTGQGHPGLWIFGMQPKLQGSIYARNSEAAELADHIEASLCTGV